MFALHLNPTIRAPVRKLDRKCRIGPKNLRHPLLRRTKAALIYRRTGNLRAVQLLLGYTKIESTVRYLGIEVDDALATRRAGGCLKYLGRADMLCPTFHVRLVPQTDLNATLHIMVVMR
jgi:hypothetical protein